MLAQKRIFRLFIGALVVVLLVSLTMNYIHYRRLQREDQYVRLVYNHFIFDVFRAEESLRAVNGTVNYLRAAVDTADAASDLRILSDYKSIVQKEDSIHSTAARVQEIANFLSYVSLALVQ